MDVSIIILTKNAGDRFRELLNRIFSQETGYSYEVLMIDSGSSDNTLDIAEEFPVKTTGIAPEEFHHGRTRNLGARLSGGDFLVYITQDALPLGNDWLQVLVDNFKEPEVAMVCGRQIAWDTVKPPERFFYDYNFPPFKVKVTPGAPDYYHDNIFISNVNSAIRKDVWQKFGFSEKVIIAEDKEFARRVLSAGRSIVYEPGAAVHHAHDFSLRQVFQRSVDYGVALSQSAGGLPRSKNWFMKRLAYPCKEAKYIVTTNKQWWKWLPYAIAYECCKLAGIAAGRIKGKGNGSQQDVEIQGTD
jgi:rhamnosyltransferase